MKKEYLTNLEIQKEELEMLKELIQFLDTNKIIYFIWAGSFLGAVRHKGFIPWDNDIDIAIPRNEYKKFINLVKNNKIKENIDAIGFELGNSDWPFIKIINKNIHIEEEAQINKYLWIDIFPLDGAPDKNKKYYKKIKFYKWVLLYKRNSFRKIDESSNNKVKKIFKQFLQNLFGMFSYKKFLNKYIKLCSKYDIKSCEYFSNNVWGVWDREKFPTKELSFTEFYTFEGLKVKGLRNYDGWLKTRYGNYMELPKEEDREIHSIKAWKE